MAGETREWLRSEIQRFNEQLPIEESSTPPPSWYTSPLFFELEKQTVFSSNWQYAMRSDLIADEPGSYHAGNILNRPYIILRDETGQLRAFYNICSHHGAALIPPQAPQTGVCSQLVCCYHGWTFDLHGRLLKATRTKGIKNFKPREWGLREIPVQQWGPFLFLWFGEPEAKSSLTELLQPFSDWLEHYNYNRDIGHRMVYHSSRTYELNCNWKIVNENYLDGEYHIPYLHPGLGSGLNMNSYKHATSPSLAFQLAAASEGPAAAVEDVGADFSDRYGNGAVYGVFFANFAINRFGDILESNHLIPITESKTHLVYEFFFDDKAIDDKEYVERTIAASHQVQLEDSGICELLHNNMLSPGFKSGRYAPTVEIGTHHFHCHLARDMKRGLAL